MTTNLHYAVIFLLAAFSARETSAQMDTIHNFEELPLAIKKALDRPKHPFKDFPFTIFQKVTDDFGTLDDPIDFNGVEYRVAYKVGVYFGEIVFYYSDSLFYVDRTSFMKYACLQKRQGAFQSINPQVIQSEIEFNSNEFGRIRFTSESKGTYRDKTFNSNNNSFYVDIGLFDVSGYFCQQVRTDRFIVPFDSLDWDANNYRTFIYLKGFDNSGPKGFTRRRLEAKPVNERYRLLLFDPFNGRLLSSSIICPLDW